MAEQLTKILIIEDEPSQLELLAYNLNVEGYHVLKAETGEEGLFSCLGYIVGIEGLEQEEAVGLLREIYQYQGHEKTIYKHRWQRNMLVMWDNRSVLHRATGGYEGHDRLLHRTTISG